MRNLLKASIAAIAVMTAFPAFAVENVVWWDFLSGGDGVRMKALIQRFNEEHKDKIEIKGTTLEWGVPYYTKLQTSAAVGQGPDIATYHLSRLAGAVTAKTVSPIDPKELESVGLKDSDYPPNAIGASTVDKVRYAVPFDVHGEVLYYNKNVLKELGALGPDGKPTGIDTLDGWRALLAKAKTAGKNGVVIASSNGDLRDIYI
ncbi:extracellular solute-binding protein, partial [Rhizobium sp. BR 314]|uniref:extracellular solute-binding protein n=1 Tax=Rhizobium sp. BR 314 TaxID=3040013 RepID=UPI0039BFBC6F